VPTAVGVPPSSGAGSWARRLVASVSARDIRTRQSLNGLRRGPPWRPGRRLVPASVLTGRPSRRTGGHGGRSRPALRGAAGHLRDDGMGRGDPSTGRLRPQVAARVAGRGPDVSHGAPCRSRRADLRHRHAGPPRAYA